MTQPQTGVAAIYGAELFYEVSGTGPALVMLHGHLLNLHQWDDQVAEFAADHTVVRYDARGFGQSTLPPEPFNHAADLHALLGFLGIERAVLMGCSNGGAASIDFALQHPEMVAGLILVGSAMAGYEPSGGVPPELITIRQEMDEALGRGDIAHGVELTLRVFTDGQNRRPEQVNQAVRERTRAMSTALFSRPPVAGAEAQPYIADATTRLGEIRVPILLVVGTEDNQLIHEVATLIVERAPNVQQALIPDAGHHPNMEHPEQFNGLVRAFLQENGL
ncbi:MAG TPA: alpha/beta fold hydrolase [Roseiflexaceae bacterium]|nr:alpha/beta fold hydrolase [Roseiflexaceae bacterium]